MTKAVLASTALTLLATSALAADLPARTVPPAPIVVAAPPAFTWTGLYVGGNIGGAWRDADVPVDQGRYTAPFPRGPNCCEAASLLAGGVAGFGPVVGLNAAALQAALAAQNRLVNFPAGFTGGAGSSDDNDLSFSGGVQAGYNVQFGALVAGFEGDISFLGGNRRGLRSFDTGSFDFAGEFFPNAGTLRFAPDVNGTPVLVEVLNDQAGPAGTSYNGSVRVSGRQSDWVATARGRLGFAFDRVLIYGTGGVAFQDAARTTATTTLNRVDCRPDVIPGAAGRVVGACVTTPTTYGPVTGRRNDIGWAAGVGLEYAALSNISIGVEYLHADFGSYNVAFIDPILTAAADRRISAVPVNNTSFATLTNPTTRDPGSAPAPVVTRVSVKDAIDLMRLKVNVRF